MTPNAIEQEAPLNRCLRKAAYGAMFALLFCASALADPADPADPELADRNYDLRQFHAQIYSKAFAKRFELSPAKVSDELPKELYAVEFVLDRDKQPRKIIHCRLRIYFDSALPVYLPEGPPAGSLAMRREGSHFFTQLTRNERGRAISWSEADRIALSKGNSPYNMAAALATRDYKFPSGGPLQGARQTMQILEYHKEILPGVGYMKLNPDCSWLARTAPYPAGWNLWVKRASGADYTRVLHEKEEDFFRWPVPSGFLARIRPIAARIAKFHITLRGHNPTLQQMMFDFIDSKG